MFNKVFVEKDQKDLAYTQGILSRLPGKFELVEIDNLDDYWGRSKKPYLQKREKLNLYIGQKKGELVKEAPFAYGYGKEKHFYFIHAYNCIYECDYCYLQGYFQTPDLVLFTNHDAIINSMQEITNKYPDCWFHAGEYSDSLALSHITREWDKYFDFFKRNPNAKLEIRTKSVNVKVLLEQNPLPNVIISFTLGSEAHTKNHDLKTPPLKTRLKAMQKLDQKGFELGIHLDPLVYTPNFESDYQHMLQELTKHIDVTRLHYVSIGVVRFTKDVHKEVQQNYSDSMIFATPMNKSFDGKIRYNRPMRYWMMNKVKSLCIDTGIDSQIIYLCMEDDD
jgi:spore photoproduct lyase